jgi:large subunit ribosomal protein L29
LTILKPDEIRDMSQEEIKLKLQELRGELARERALVSSGGSLDNPGKIKELRRTIARVLTILKETQKRGVK